MKNYYELLGIPENASPEEIKAAFKQKAVQLHPDKHAGNADMEERFKEINEAYQILANPYKKASHDLELQYARFTSSRKAQDAPHTYQRPPHYRPRPYYKEQPISPKENNRATLYAFAMTAAIAVLVMIVRGFYHLYLERKYEALLESRRETFAAAQDFYSKDQVRESLLMLSDLSPFKPEEEDMKAFHSGIMEDVIFMGEANFDGKDFAQAIRYYELVEQFSPYKPNAMRARLALSYRYTDQPERSLIVLKELLEVKYEVVATLVQMADVYEEDLNKPDAAKDYLELARDVAVNEYRGKFGKAYMLVIDHRFVPRDHYDLYLNLATVYNELNEPELSIGISNWMKRLWPDSAQAYVLAAKSHEKRSESALACKEFNKAIALGHSAPLPLLCR